MAKERSQTGAKESHHRGRIQAQGGGTEKSVVWTEETPPTISQMLEKCSLLETKLSKSERKDREESLRKLRAFLQIAAGRGGIDAPCSKSWKKRGSKDIRIDLEVHSGRAAVPDEVAAEKGATHG